MLEKALEQPVQMAARTSFLNSSSGLNKSFSQFLAFAHEIGLKGDDENWVIDSEDWTIRASTIFYANDKLHLLNLFCCSSSYCVATISLLEAGPDGKILLVNEQLVKGSEDTYKFDYLTGVESDQIFHALPITTEKILIAGGNKRIILDLKSNTVTEISRQYQAAIGFDYLHNQLMTITNDHIYSMSLPKQEKIFFNSFMINSESHSPVRVKEPKQKAVDDHLLCLLGLKKKDPIDKTDWIEASVLIERLAVDLLQSFSETSQTLSDNQLASILLKERNYRVDEETFEELLSIIDMHFAKKTAHSFDDVLLETLVCILVGHLQVAEQITRQSQSLRSDPDLSLISLEIINKCLNLLLLIADDSKERIKKLKIEGIKSIISLCQMKKTTNELSETLSQNHERFSQEFFSAASRLLANPKVTRRSEFTDLIEFALTLDSVGAEKSHLEVILKALETSCISAVEKELLENGQGLETRAEDLQSKISRIVQEKNIQRLTSEIFWNISSGTQSAVRDAIVAQALDSLWKQLSPKVMTSVTTGVLPDSARSCLWMDLLLDTCQYLILKDEENRRLTIASIPNFVTLGLELVKVACKKDTNEPIQAGEFAGYSKERKPIEIEVSHEDSFIYVKLDPFKDYIIHLDRAEGDITYQLDILKPQLWKKAIPDRHEYSIIYYPHVVLSASHGRRIARVRGCWSIGLAAKPFAKEDLGSKKATVTLYSKDASSQNKPVLFSNIFLSFMVGKELPDPPFLGDSILELPVKGASMAEEEDAKRTYLKSLKLAKPLTPMDSANFCKSSITVDQHVGQLEGYLTQVDAHIGMLDLASDLLETSAPIAACFSFARRLLQVKCQSERLQPAKLRLLNRLLQHPQLGWLVLATQAPAAFSPDLLSSTFAALGNLSDACFSDRQTVLSFFHLAALVSRCSLDEHQLTALKDLLGRVGLLHKEPSVNLQVATDLHVTASAYEDIDSMAKFKTGQKVSAASEGDSVSHNTNVKTLYMSDNNEGSSLQNDNDDEDDSSSSSIKPAGKKSQSESKSSSDSDDDDDDDDDSSSDSDTSKAKKKDAKADESKNTMKATNDLDHENLNSPMSPISLAVPMVEKELKLTLKESYPQPPANLKQSEADKASQLLEVMALLGEAKSLDPYFDLRLLPPSNLLLVPTLSKLLLERLADQVSKNTFYFGSDPLGLPYYKLDEAAGLNVAVLKDTVIDWSSKYHSRTECPAQLWFNTFKRSTFGSIFGGITMPGPDVYPVRSCVDGDWKGNEVLELLTSRNIDQIKQKFESIKEDWKPLLAEQDIALMVESSADLWQKLHSNKVTQVKTKESDENLEIVENKFSKLKAKLRPPKVEVQKEKKLSLPSFYLDTCPVTSRLSSKLPICNVKLIQEELLQRLIQELVAFNLPHLELESDFLVSIAEAAFTRQAVLDFYEKSNLEPSAIYLDNLARAIPDSSLHAIQRKLVEGIKHANEWILLGQFRLVQHVVNISIEKKHRSMVEKVNSSLVLCFDIVDSLLRLELKNSPQRRNLILDAFEWFHTLFNARDTAASKGILDTKAEQIEEMMTVMDAAYFDGFLNSCEDTGDHLEAFISMSIRAELISKEKVESFTNVDSRFIIRMMQIYRELASYSLGKTFEEIKDQVIRGILMQKVSNETDKALPQSTKYILAPRIPLKINLAPEYSEFALRDLRLEKSNKEENDEDEESGVSCQIYEPSNPEKKINLAQVYSAFNQNDISIVPELPSKASVEDWPVRDCQLKEREFVIVFPPVSKNAFILIEEDGVIALDETKMEQLSYYYDSKSAFNTANKSVSLWDSIMISGYIYANNGLINNLPITLSHFDETGLFFYNESLSSFELFCPFDDSLQRKFKAFAESDRVFFQVHSPIEARPTQITFVKKFQYFIMFETGQLLHVTFEKDGLEGGGWAEALWSKYGDPQQRKLNEVSEAEGMDNQSILGKWKNSHDNQMRIYDFSKKYLKSIVPGSECVALLFDSPNSDTYLLNIIASLEKETTISIPKKEISRFIAHYQSEDNPDLTQFHILFSDGSLMLIEARNDRSDNWVKYATVSSDYKVFSMATFNNKVCVLASDKNKENKVGLYHVTANETGDKLSARLDIHDLGSAFLFNERSCIHDSPTFFATECSINPLCVFKKYNQLLDYPLSFSLNKVDQKIQFSSYAGDPDFFEKFQSENIDDNSIAFMLTAPCNWTIGGQKNDDCQPLVEFFLKSYNESSAFTEEDVDANTDRYSIDGAETLIQSSAVDFSGVIPPRVVVRVRGKKKQEFSTLSNMKFECPETDPAYFEIMPNLILLKGQEWERYKEETRIIWEPELNSITPSQWIEVKDTLVDLTWNIAFDDNPYSSKVYSETHKVNNIKQELKDLLPKVPYFTSHPQVQVNHLLGAHCSIAIMDYWTQCYTVSSRFVRRKPVSNHLDNAAQNMFGSTINEMRFHFSYCDSVGNFEMQVDRYRAEKCTELDQNQSFLNQLYYQIMVKANWNSVILKKMEGIELNFVGEDGYDAGGLLKEYFSQISNEVTKTTKLFVPSANFGDAVEENDRYVPNPELISEKDLGNFYKFGVILGFTFKFFGSLAIDMPACFWEHLLGRINSSRQPGRLERYC
jgi:hypothetical protein